VFGSVRSATNPPTRNTHHVLCTAYGKSATNDVTTYPSLIIVRVGTTLLEGT
jgi:hypothetical protein